MKFKDFYFVILIAYMRSCFSHVRLSVTLWTVAQQCPLSIGFSRTDNWSGLLKIPLGDLPDPGIEPVSLMYPALTGRFFTTSTTWEALYYRNLIYKKCPILSLKL